MNGWPKWGPAAVFWAPLYPTAEQRQRAKALLVAWRKEAGL